MLFHQHHNKRYDGRTGEGDYSVQLKLPSLGFLDKLNYKVIAMGDSYNDIAMLKEADNGILFNPPDNVKNEFPELPVTFDYETLKQMIQKILSNRSKPSKSCD